MTSYSIRLRITITGIMTKLARLVIVVITLASWSASGQGMSASTGDPVLAHSLYSNGYYLLSALEWSRVVVGAADANTAAAARLEMAYSFWRMDDTKAAYSILDSLGGQTNVNASIRLHALSLKAKIALSVGDFDLSADAAERALRDKSECGEQIEVDLKKCRVAGKIVRIQRKEAASMMRESALASEDLITDVESRALPWKSPALAGTLSAVLPGAGQTYCGRWREGFAAFSVNAVFAGAAYECFDKDLPMLGSAVVVAGITWYVGNVFNAVNVAHKNNDENLAMTVTGWLKKLDIGLDEQSLRVGFKHSF